MTTLYRVLYCSRNTIQGSPEQVEAEIRGILAASRRNNGRDGITGGLLFSDGCFAQVLEGPVAAVEEAFERIQCDERHSEVTVLQAGPIERRDFPDWSMAFTGTLSPGSQLDQVSLEGALANPASGGAILAKLRAVVVRESQWLAALPVLTEA